MDFKKFYDLENYLFGEVTARFKDDQELSAFDFFCIIIWKANRAKSRIAALLLKKESDLETAVKRLTSALANKTDPKSKMKLLILDWGFKLPIASAILTVLVENDFTIYDYRVCQQLGAFHQIAEDDFEEMWPKYEEFVKAVRAMDTPDADLRNKDRWLWGKSFSAQLKRDIENRFENLREQARFWVESLMNGDEFAYNDVYIHLETNFPEIWEARGSESCREDAKHAVKKAIEKCILQRKKKDLFLRIGQSTGSQNSPNAS